jgi:hypothetical protein
MFLVVEKLMVYWYTMEKIEDNEIVVIKHEHLESFKTAKEAEDYIKKLSLSAQLARDIMALNEEE